MAFIGGVADANGYGWAIAKALAEAGATIAVGTWPPVLGIFKATLDAGKLEEDLKTSTGDKWEISKVGWVVGEIENGSPWPPPAHSPATPT